ncbi:Anthranilate synthase component 1 [uncultured archaeon]|nr:Anthranilate synthase component 1 [uncultured archaeon]
MKTKKEATTITPIHITVAIHPPEAAYAILKKPGTYLLESSDGGEKMARYSFIGFNPTAELKIKDGKAQYTTKEPSLKNIKIPGEPLQALRSITKSLKLGGSPLARFTGGLTGYLAYDLVRYHVNLPNRAKDDLNHPDAHFLLAKNNIIYDHKKQVAYITENHFGDPREIDEEEIRGRLMEIASRLSKLPGIPSQENSLEQPEAQSNVTRHEYEESVRQAKQYIKAGDIFQAVLSQRLTTEYSGDQLRVYHHLKQHNPSPYMYFLDFGDRQVIGASPEMLVRVEGKKALTYPIAGTRPRGKTRQEDALLEREMLSDEKECAEHVMLVDLGRNDLGRVCDYGSVEVTKFMRPEKYSHVQHIVSEVEGTLAEGKDSIDALQSIFPAGTVSGAPKVRAMEIIEELEPTRRGIYAGAVGYLSADGNIDTAITIRTVVIENGKATVQAGAGIVADSDPRREFEETLNKAGALLAAVNNRQ